MRGREWEREKEKEREKISSCYGEWFCTMSANQHFPPPEKLSPIYFFASLFKRKAIRVMSCVSFYWMFASQTN